MANASRDENGVHTIIGTLDTDGRTLVRIKADSTSHGIYTSDGTTGSDNGPTNAPRDENDIPAFMAVSSTDGRTPVVVYANSSGQILVKST
jgi:hypothetical protein